MRGIPFASRTRAAGSVGRPAGRSRAAEQSGAARREEGARRGEGRAGQGTIEKDKERGRTHLVRRALRPELGVSKDKHEGRQARPVGGRAGAGAASNVWVSRAHPQKPSVLPVESSVE